MFSLLCKPSVSLQAMPVMPVYQVFRQNHKNAIRVDYIQLHNMQDDHMYARLANFIHTKAKKGC